MLVFNNIIVYNEGRKGRQDMSDKVKEMRDAIWEAMRLVNEYYGLNVDFYDDHNWDNLEEFIEDELIDIMINKLEKIKGE